MATSTQKSFLGFLKNHDIEREELAELLEEDDARAEFSDDLRAYFTDIDQIITHCQSTLEDIDSVLYHRLVDELRGTSFLDISSSPVKPDIPISSSHRKTIPSEKHSTARHSKIDSWPGQRWHDFMSLCIDVLEEVDGHSLLRLDRFLREDTQPLGPHRRREFAQFFVNNQTEFFPNANTQTLETNQIRRLLNMTFSQFRRFQSIDIISCMLRRQEIELHLTHSSLEMISVWSTMMMDETSRRLYSSTIKFVLVRLESDCQSEFSFEFDWTKVDPSKCQTISDVRLWLESVCVVDGCEVDSSIDFCIVDYQGSKGIGTQTNLTPRNCNMPKEFTTRHEILRWLLSRDNICLLIGEVHTNYRVFRVQIGQNLIRFQKSSDLLKCLRRLHKHLKLPNELRVDDPHVSLVDGRLDRLVELFGIY